jgi:hypothetical protein
MRAFSGIELQLSDVFFQLPVSCVIYPHILKAVQRTRPVKLSIQGLQENKA